MAIRMRILGFDVIDDDGIAQWNNWECTCTVTKKKYEGVIKIADMGNSPFCEIIPPVLVRQSDGFWAVLRDGRQVLFDQESEERLATAERESGHEAV